MSEKSSESAAASDDAGRPATRSVLDVDPRLARLRRDARDPQYCGALVLAYELTQGRSADTIQVNACTRRLPGQDERACQRIVWWLPGDRNLVTSLVEPTSQGEQTDGPSWGYRQTAGCPVLRRCGWPITPVTEEAEDAAAAEAVIADAEATVAGEAAELAEEISAEAAATNLAELPTAKVAKFSPPIDPLAADAAKL
jgi:hypothetical protein